MMNYCPRCEKYVNLITTIIPDTNSAGTLTYRKKYHQCEFCYMILCWEDININVFDEQLLEPESE